MKGSVASTVGYLAATFWKEIGAQACIHGADGSFPSGLRSGGSGELDIPTAVFEAPSLAPAVGPSNDAASAAGSECLRVRHSAEAQTRSPTNMLLLQGAHGRACGP